MISKSYKKGYSKGRKDTLDEITQLLTSPKYQKEIFFPAFNKKGEMISYAYFSDMFIKHTALYEIFNLRKK